VVAATVEVRRRRLRRVVAATVEVRRRSLRRVVAAGLAVEARRVLAARARLARLWPRRASWSRLARRP
jgi:hypothetical protein